MRLNNLPMVGRSAGQQNWTRRDLSARNAIGGPSLPAIVWADDGGPARPQTV